MTLQQLSRKYPENLCVCCPYERDGDQQVKSWICLRVFNGITALNDARAAMEGFERDGVKDPVLIPTGRITLKGDLAARYYRVFRGISQ